MVCCRTSRPPRATTTLVRARAAQTNTTNSQTTEHVVPPFVFRRSVGLCIFSKSQGNKVFAARRRDDTSGSWQLPQGGIDPPENPLMAAHRELEEETGISKDLVRVVTSIDAWLDYEHPTFSQGVEYKGQTQKWVLLEFLGADDDVNLCHLGEDAREFEEWRWMGLDEVVDGIVWFKKGVYQEVYEGFRGYLAG